MFYTLAAAAKASGLGASAIRAAIERGQITAIKDLFDEWQVEEAELHRLYFPIGPATGKRDECSSTPSPAIRTLEGGAEASLEQAGHTLAEGREGTAADSATQVDPSRVIHDTEVARIEAVAPSTTAADDTDADTTQVEGDPVASRQCLAPFGDPSGNGRHGNQHPQLRFSGLDQTDRIAIGNTLFWESEIKIGERQDTLGSAIRPLADRRRAIAFTGALLAGVGIGWVAGLGSYHFFGRSLIPVSKDSGGYSAAPSTNQIAGVEKERRDPAAGALVTGKIAPPAVPEARARRRYASNQSTPQAPESRTAKFASIARQNSTEAALDNPGEPTGSVVPQAMNGFARRAAVPETKPTTIEGWSVRSVYNGTAVLEGPAGVWTAARGDTVPGLGRIDSIVLWGSRWIVATSRGLVTTP
jgi:hypothetical protein